VDVDLSVGRLVVVDDQRDLLNIEPAAPDVRRDQNASGAASEVLHNRVSLLLEHIAVDRADREVVVSHLLCQPVDLVLGVAENDCLGNGERVVEVAEGLELPGLFLDGNKELLNPIQSQLISLHKNLDGVLHELLGHEEDLVRKGRRDDHALSPIRKVAVDVVDLHLEALVEHLVGLVEDEHLERASPEMMPLDHVIDPPWGPRDNMLTILQHSDVIAHLGSADAHMRGGLHVVSKAHDDLSRLLCELPRRRQDQDLRLSVLQVDHAQRPEREDGRLPGARLALDDDVAALDDRDNSSLLDSRGLDEAVRMDA
jgi:hypothetical protein